MKLLYLFYKKIKRNFFISADTSAGVITSFYRQMKIKWSLNLKRRFVVIKNRQLTCRATNDLNIYCLFCCRCATVIKNRFIWAGREKREYKDIAEYLIRRFIDVGANPDAKSPIGTVREILSGTHLLDA